MAETTPPTEELQAVTLAEDQPKATESVPAAGTPQVTSNTTDEGATPSAPAANDVVEDPWAVEDAQLNQTLVENTNESASDDDAPQSEASEALSKLKQSSFRLGGAVATTASSWGQSLGINSALSSLSSSVKNLDSEHGVTQNITSVGSSFGSWISSSVKQVDEQLQVSQKVKEVDEQFQVSQKTKDLGSAVGQKTKELGSAVGTVIPAQEIGSSIKNFDETHGIVKGTASTLAAGADLLTSSITAIKTDGPMPVEADPTLTLAPDETDELDQDGLPSSFQ